MVESTDARGFLETFTNNFTLLLTFHGLRPVTDGGLESNEDFRVGTERTKGLQSATLHTWQEAHKLCVSDSWKHTSVPRPGLLSSPVVLASLRADRTSEDVPCCL